MRFRLQLITVGEDGSERMHSVAELERDSTLRLETTGLTLAEGKQILKHLQEVVVEEQVEACVVQHRHCAICSKPLSTKGHHQIKLQTVFGNLQIRSPRLRCCPCSEGDRTKSFSPLAQVLTERPGRNRRNEVRMQVRQAGSPTIFQAGATVDMTRLPKAVNAAETFQHRLR
jgi:hypothetical protein